MECNAGSAVQITHHFLAQMVSERMTGVLHSSALAIDADSACLVAATVLITVCTPASIGDGRHSADHCVHTAHLPTSVMQICPHVQKAKGLRGCFVYTSSAAAAIVSPFTVILNTLFILKLPPPLPAAYDVITWAQNVC
jgi:hypothetical protein